MMEEPASHSPHFGSLSLYHILQMSWNHQIKILISCLTFRSKFIKHNIMMIEKMQYCFHSCAHLLCFVGARQSRTLQVWGLFFGFNIITVNPCLITSNYISQKIFIIALWRSLGTKFAETWCIPKSSVRIMWHKPMNIPNSCATYGTVSRFPWMFFSLAVIRRFESWSWRLARPLILIHSRSSIFKTLEQFLGCLMQDITISFMQHVFIFCSCLSTLKQNTNSLFFANAILNTQQNNRTNHKTSNKK